MSPFEQPENRVSDAFRTTLGIGGFIAVGIGLLILFFPGKSAAATMTLVAALVAAYAFVAGMTYLGAAVFARGFTGWGRAGRVLLAALYLVAGVVMAVNLEASAVTLAAFLTITLGLMWIIEGVLTLTLLGRSDHKGWSVCFAVLTLLAGVILILSPLFAALTLWWLLGVLLVVTGVVQIIRALKTR